MKTGYNVDYSYFKDTLKSMWIDYLRLSFRGSFNYSFLDLDYDNSHFGYYNIWNQQVLVEKVHIKGSGDGYKFTIDYNGYPVPLFIYRMYKWFHLFDFYGSFFRLIELNYLENDYLNVVIATFNIPENACISRIDYRVDFLSEKTPLDTPRLYKVLKHSTNISSIREWKKWQKLTNWQCGDKDSKAVVFRCYDKLLDTEKKQKKHLYFDYYRFSSVHRLEFECSQRFCKWYDLYNLDKLIDKIKSVFCIDTQGWQGPIFYRYNSDKLIYNRKEIDMYFSHLKKWVENATFNYKNSLQLKNYENTPIELNPLVVCYDYISNFNENTISTHSIVLDFIDYWKKTKNFNRIKWIF